MIRTMRPVIVAANWKMNTTPADAGELAMTIASRTRVPGVQRVICPPFVCLAAVRDALADASDDVAVGAQDVHHEVAGAFTGDISAAMLDGLATWVIVGHSERRRDHAETDERIAGKLARAAEAGLRPILCIGEQLEVREQGDDAAAALVVDQLWGAVMPNDRDALIAAGLVIAYEPVWAIGTGKNARGADAAAMAGRDSQRPPGHRLGRAGRGRTGSLRRQCHGREHRRIPRRTLHRRGPRRRRIAQARRDGRHRRPGRRHGGRSPLREPDRVTGRP